MRINPDVFFPCTKTDLRKLVNWLLQAVFPDDTEYIEQIKSYLKERITYWNKRKYFYNNHYEDLKGDAIDKYYRDRQNLAVDAALTKIDNILKKLNENLEYLETL